MNLPVAAERTDVKHAEMLVDSSTLHGPYGRGSRSCERILGLLEHAEPHHSRVDPSASPLATSCLRSPSADYGNIPRRHGNGLRPKNAKTVPSAVKIGRIERFAQSGKF